MRGASDGRGLSILATAAVGAFLALLGLEVLTEDERASLSDLAGEALQIGLLVAVTVTTALLVLRVQAQAEESRALRADIAAVREQSRRWREEVAGEIRELAAAIHRQFDAWGLTLAEREVGLLLLKGLSHKEIARVRRTSEATIRQQAAAIYQKANLSGRAALAAYFLEDLLAPPVERPPLEEPGARPLRRLPGRPEAKAGS
jgi:DNA-binding NarL/FixJ family response regulator